MRIVAGEWRGRRLVAPPGSTTRPTADRVRQAVFDILMHAEWAGRAAIDGAAVIDVFAGTGALGLEALSRGAASACFIESDAVALKALRANVIACRAGERAEILAVDVLKVAAIQPAVMAMVRQASPGSSSPRPDPAASLVFLDPPYGQTLVPRALTRLRDVGRIRPDALIIAEIGRDEPWRPDQPLLAERQHGAATVLMFRAR
jgi:16S rRNA (guanine966-N2)-methyltransferase